MSDIETYLQFINQEIDVPYYQEVQGTHYLYVLSAFHENLQPKTYVEIGIDRGEALKLANSVRKIGIDPEPRLEGDFMQHLIYEKTSDQFFEEDANNLFSKEPIDFAFIDGLHLCEFALRDFINLEKYCHEKSYIAIHDVLPRWCSEASRGRVSVSWTGDVYRVILALRKYRPDLNITILDAQPTGLAIISGLDPTSKFLQDNYEEIVAEIMNIHTLSFIKARDLIMHTFPTDLYLMNFMFSHTLKK